MPYRETPATDAPETTPPVPSYATTATTETTFREALTAYLPSRWGAEFNPDPGMALTDFTWETGETAAGDVSYLINDVLWMNGTLVNPARRLTVATARALRDQIAAEAGVTITAMDGTQQMPAVETAHHRWPLYWRDEIEADPPPPMVPHTEFRLGRPPATWWNRPAPTPIEWPDPVPAPGTTSPRRRTPRPYGAPDAPSAATETTTMRLFVRYDFEDLLYRHMDSSRVCGWVLHNWHRLDTSRINYVDVDGEKLSYLPADREHRTLPDGAWSPVGRQSGRPARVIKMLIPKDEHDRFTDKDMEEFTNIVKSLDVRGTAEFVEVHGRDIAYWYNGDRYAYGTGSLESSCMRHPHCQDYFSIYTNMENRAIISLLILKDKHTSLLRGRALVWRIPGAERPVMDRVYGTDTVQAAFRAYATEQGWYVRAFNSFEHEMTFLKDGQVTYLDMQVALPYYRARQFPYLDTFKYFDYAHGTFSNNRFKPCDYTLMNTRGEGAPYRWGAVVAQPGETFVTELTEAEYQTLRANSRFIGRPDPVLVAMGDDDDDDDYDDGDYDGPTAIW